MSGQVGHEVGDHADRADARAAAAVRNAEGLVQVEVADVAAELARCGHADQGIHVGAIHIDAPAVRMHQLAEFLDLRFKHAVRAGVGDHHGGQVGAVLLALGLEVGHVDIALAVAGRDDHAHAGHLRAGRVGAVGGRRNQADVAMALAVGFEVGLDHEQAGVFALRAGVGLQADAGIARGFAKPVAQLAVELRIAFELVSRRKGMDARKLRPGDRDHLAGGVEFHGAAAQRNHAAVQRQVFVAQRAYVAQHAGFRVVGVENRVRQKGRSAAQLDRDQRLHAFFKVGQARQQLALPGKERPDHFDVAARGGFVQRDPQMAVQPRAQVGARLAGLGGNAGGGLVGLDGERVKGVVVADLVAHLSQPARQDRGAGRHALGDAFEALRAVVDRVHAGHHGRQNLCGANIRGGFFAANMLLARLQGQPVGGVAMRVNAHAHQPPRQRALELVAASQVGRVRSAIAHGHAKALRGAQHDVGAPFAGRHQQRQRQQVGSHAKSGMGQLGPLGQRLEVMNHAVAGRVLGQHAEVIVVAHELRQGLGRRAQPDFNAQRPGTRLHHLDRLRMAVTRHQKGLALALDTAPSQRHGLGRGSGFIEHGGVGHRHAGQVADHGLKVDQRFQPTLGNFGLVRRVSGVPGRVFQNVAQDHARRMGIVIALANEALENLVSGGHGLEFGQRRRLGNGRRNRHVGAARNRAWHDGLDQRPPRGRTDRTEHMRFIGRPDADVAGYEFTGIFELAQGFGR